MALSAPVVPYISLPTCPGLRQRRHLHLLTISPRPLVALPPRSLRSDRVAISDEESMGDGFFETVEELEKMVRDPSDVLGDMVDKLSSRELQLVLVYFSQEGRDSYCALEVFDWLRKENRVDRETMELMVSIACGWVGRLVAGGGGVEDVVGLLYEMECVGVEPGFSMVEKVVSLYWERGRKEEAVEFVRFVLGKGKIDGEVDDGRRKGGPIGYLAWKIMMDGDYLDAAKMVIKFREEGLKPELYSYLIGMTALVKEQKEFSKSLRKLKISVRAGLVAELDKANLDLVEKYQSELLRSGVRLSEWALQEGGSKISGLVHERLLALYTCAGYGLEAEHHLWQMKLCGKEPDKELYDIVLAICASQNETNAIHRLLARIDNMSTRQRKKTLLWLLRGYVKGGFYTNASETLIRMLESGLHPDYLDRAAVLQGLRKSIQDTGNAEPFLKLCKQLSDKELIGPCIVYLYLNSHKLWVMKMI